MINPVTVTVEMVPALNSLFGAYYAANVTWGSLHIALDDGNCKRSDFEFCLNYAVQHKDYLGAYLASVILSMPDYLIAELEQDSCDLENILLTFALEAITANEIEANAITKIAADKISAGEVETISLKRDGDNVQRLPDDSLDTENKPNAEGQPERIYNITTKIQDNLVEPAKFVILDVDKNAITTSRIEPNAVAPIRSVTLDSMIITDEMLEKVLNAHVPGGAPVEDYLDMNAVDAQEIGIHLDPPGKWHWHSDVRNDQRRDALKIVLRTAIEAALDNATSLRKPIVMMFAGPEALEKD